MTNSLFIQIFMVVLAVAIFLLYIKPTVSEIRVTQDQVDVYEAELAKVNSVNALLQENVSAINSLPMNNVQALERYLPTTINEVSVMRDLQSLVDGLGIKLVSLDYTGVEKSNDNSSTNDGFASGETVVAPEATLVSATVNLAVETSYFGMKELLSALEVSDYQFTVKNAQVTPSESGLLSVDLELMIYALADKMATTE